MNKQEFIEKMKQKKNMILAIDGQCASGKSTLGAQLHDLLGGNLFHMDDFYLPPEKRTPERYAQPGGNVDYERFLETVLKPLSMKQDVFYQPLDCTTLTLTEGMIVPYHPINIIEGSYSLHPTLEKYYTDVIVLRISSAEQLERLKKRNPEQFDMFVQKWIPLENLYLDTFHIHERYPLLEESKT